MKPLIGRSALQAILYFARKNLPKNLDQSVQAFKSCRVLYLRDGQTDTKILHSCLETFPSPGQNYERET